MLQPVEVTRILETMLGPSASVFVDTIKTHLLHPLEEQFVAGAVPERVAEFSSGRHLARAKF